MPRPLIPTSASQVSVATVFLTGLVQCLSVSCGSPDSRESTAEIEANVPTTAAPATSDSIADGWPGWGGPSRDFSVASATGAWTWGEAGPSELWRHPLGPGEAAVVAAGDVLYTSFRDGDDEVVRAFDAASGERLWDHRTHTPLWNGFFNDQGVGPYATPALVRDRLLTVNVTGTLISLDTNTGELAWSANVWSKWRRDPSKSGPAVVGYTPSPLIVGDLVIVVGGGPGRAVQAYDWRSGDLSWSAGNFDPAYAAPRLLRQGGRDHLVVLAADGVHGLDPRDGTELWSHPHETSYRVNAMMPVFDGQTLILSSAYDTGSRGLEVIPMDAGFEATEAWTNRRIQVHHSSAVITKDLFVGSSGDFGPAFLFAVDPTTGETLWRERGFAKANLVAVGDQVLLLDEDGELALFATTKNGPEILGRKELFRSRSWAPPSVVGNTVFARDSQDIVALRFEAAG